MRDASAEQLQLGRQPLSLGMLKVAAAALALGACDSGEDSSQPNASGPAPLPSQALPLLTCLDPVVNEGDCRSDGDCGGGSCVLEVSRMSPDRGPLTLTCSAQQGTGEARAICETGGDCQSGLCGLTGTCLAPCAEHADCETGLFCLPVEARLRGREETPHGADAALAPVMACARNLAFHEGVRLGLGPTLSGVAPDTLASLRLEGIGSTTMLYLKPDCGTQLRIEQMHALATSQQFFDYQTTFSGQGALNPVANVGALVPILVPNNPRVTDYQAGLELSLFVSEESEVHSLSAAEDARSARILDLNIFLVGGGREVVEDGFHPGDPHLMRFVERLENLYADIAITVGTVRVFDVVGGLREELNALESRIVMDDQGNELGLEIPGLDQVFELSVGLEYAGLNLFLVSDMGDVLGISGGIPGALGVQGTPASGVAVAVDVAGLDLAPFVALHEMSHQMGLFHTSEFDGLSFEPLDDTPVCGAESDRNGDGVVSSSECRNLGAENLMFWTGSGRQLSPQQEDILRRSIVLR